MTAASAAAAISMVICYFRVFGSVFCFPNVASTLRFSSSHSLSMSSRDLDVIEALLSTRSTSIRIAYPRHIPMITPMLFSIYINTTLAHSHAAVKLRRFSLAVDLLLPGFIRGCGKTYPTRAVNFLSSKTLTVYLLFPGWRSCSCSSMPICIFRGPGRARSVFLIRFVISGIDAGTPPPPPPPPYVLLVLLVPLDLLVPSVLAAIIDLLLPGWRSCTPALGMFVCYFQVIGSDPPRSCGHLVRKLYLCFPGCPPFRLRGQTVNSCLVGYPSSIRFRRTGLILSLSVVQWICS